MRPASWAICGAGAPTWTGTAPISSAASAPPRAAPCSSRAPRRGSVCTCRATARSSWSLLPAGRASEWRGPRSASRWWNSGCSWAWLCSWEARCRCRSSTVAAGRRRRRRSVPSGSSCRRAAARCTSHGTPLAVTQETYHVGIAPNELRDPTADGALLSRRLGLTARTWQQALRRRYAYFAGPYSALEVQPLRSVRGVHLESVLNRFYPDPAVERAPQRVNRPVRAWMPGEDIRRRRPALAAPRVVHRPRIGGGGQVACARSHDHR